MFQGFLDWKNSKEDNIWMIRAIHHFAKYGKVSDQVAFWRLRDGNLKLEMQSSKKNVQMRND